MAEAKVKKLRYEVLEYQGNTWVRRVGHDNPVAYVEGVGPEQHEKASKAAGHFGMKEVKEEEKRWGRAQAQMDIIMSIEGLHIWEV